MMELNTRVDQTLKLIKETERYAEETTVPTDIEMYAMMKPFSRKIKRFRILITALSIAYLLYSFSTLAYNEYMIYKTD